jgi:hypothetical protein
MALGACESVVVCALCDEEAKSARLVMPLPKGSAKSHLYRKNPDWRAPTVRHTHCKTNSPSLLEILER